MRTIKIRQTEYDVILTVWAYFEICELCGSIEKISEWIKNGNSHEKLKKLTSIMIEAADRKKLYKLEADPYLDKIKLERPELPRFFKAADVIAVYTGIFAEISASMAHEVPQNVEINASKEDYAYEFIMNRKAEEKGIKRPNKALPIIAKGLSCGLDYKTIMNAMTPGEVLQIWLYQIEARGGTGNGKK